MCVVCVCLCVCGRARVCARVCVRARVCGRACVRVCVSMSVGLYTLRSTEQPFETNNRCTSCFRFSVLLLYKMIHRMTKNTPSTINQSFRLDMKHLVKITDS